MLNVARLVTPPAERQITTFTKWMETFVAQSPEEMTMRHIAPAFAALLESNKYREAKWKRSFFSFVTDSEHCFTIKATKAPKHALDSCKRKSVFWCLAKSSDVPYKDWDIFGDALRNIDLSFINFQRVGAGFRARLLLEISPAIGVYVDIGVVPTDRYQYTPHCGRVEVATTHLLRG